MLDCYLSKNSPYPGQAVVHPSLNREKRNRQLQRIVQENNVRNEKKKSYKIHFVKRQKHRGYENEEFNLQLSNK